MTLVVDLAITRVVHAMRASAFVPVRACAEKLLAEERYHAHHGHGWLRTLAADAAVRAGLAARIDAALASVTDWFGPADARRDAALVAAGIKDARDADLAAAVLADVREAAAPFGITLADPPRPGADWDPARRRSGAGHPSDEVLYHLRGTKNEIFKHA
jgi:1,2-phenylacetyl-CoA epoxidase catalytic subunit